jgi:hypothetical protein
MRINIVGLVFVFPACLGVAAGQTPDTGFPRTNKVAAGYLPTVGANRDGSSITGVASPPADCIVALSPTAGPSGSIAENSSCPGCTSALFVGNNGLVSAAGCGVQVNSTTSGSLWLEWGNIYTNYMGDAATEYRCGTSQVPVGPGDPGCFDPEYDNVTMYPKPYPPVSDPLSYLNPPASTTCDSGNLYVITGGADGGTGSYNITPGYGDVPSCPDIVITQSTGVANVTFNPGIYDSITMGYCDSSDCYPPADPIVTFTSGIYSIMGSVPNYSDQTGNYYCLPQQMGYSFTSSVPPCGLSIDGSGGTIDGKDVVFYLGPTAGGVVMDGYFCSGCAANVIGLIAPTTGEYAGILLYQDRSNAYPACIGGCSSFPADQPSSSFILSGAMYLPDAGLYYTGCCQGTIAVDTYQFTVADTLYLGFDNYYSNYSSLPGGPPVKRPVP